MVALGEPKTQEVDARQVVDEEEFRRLLAPRKSQCRHGLESEEMLQGSSQETHDAN